MDYPRLHTLTLLSTPYANEAHKLFRDACSVTDPMWTKCGPNPDNWKAPDDAAGGLILWNSDGGLIRAEPATDDDAAIADRAYSDLLAAGCVIGRVRASYASSGGRMVALCTAYGQWWLTVGRCESVPRSGATEDVIRYADPKCRIFVITEIIGEK